MLVALWLLLAPSPAEASVIDRVVASVEEQLVTDSEVRLEAVLSALDRSSSPFWARDRVTPLERLIDAAVVRELAGDVALYQPEEEQVTARLEAVRALFPDRVAWQRFLDSWGLDEDALRAILRRRMVVERYLTRNVQVRGGTREDWWAACEQLLETQRARYRIRRIPPMSATP